MTDGQELEPEVHKVIGAPGTGKTTRVVGNPELELDGLFMENIEEYSLDEQMLVTYTNAGVDEAADRLETLLNRMADRSNYLANQIYSGGRSNRVPRNKIDARVTTIHSQCYGLLNDHPNFNGLDRKQVVDHWNKKKFCDAHDLEYGWDDDDEGDIMSADKAAGNALFDLYGWLQSNRKDHSDWEDCPADWSGQTSPERYLNAWEDWKDERNLVGFGDMIEEVVKLGYEQLQNLGWGVLFPDEDTTTMEMFVEARRDPNRDADKIRGKGAFIDTKVLYVDEVQDLTKLQWEWYLLQKLVCEKVYIGGDDDQTIYGWAGANPDFMLNEEGSFEVLETTYRIPREIWDTCNNVIHEVDHRQEKEVTPDGEGGEVVTLERPSPGQVVSHAQEGETMILFRARYHIDEFREDLHEKGIPYDNMSTHETWDEQTVTVRDALAKIKNERGSIRGDEFQTLKDVATQSMLSNDSDFSETERVMSNFGSGVPIEKVKNSFDLSTRYTNSRFTPEKFLDQADDDEINYYQKEAVKGNLENGNEDMDPERVRIGTIHSAKGKEAETVILGLDSTGTILENMEEDTMGQPGKRISDAERRVYYVGMTRASETLVLSEGTIDPSNTIKIGHLLPEYSSDRKQSQAQLGSTKSW